MPGKSKPVVKRAETLGDYIRRQREAANVSLRKVAEQSGISAAVLREIENGIRNPSGALLTSIAGALRLSAETLQLQAGVLDPKSPEESDTGREILRDPYLTERQRQVLLEVYQALRVQNQRS